MEESSRHGLVGGAFWKQDVISGRTAVDGEWFQMLIEFAPQRLHRVVDVQHLGTKLLDPALTRCRGKH